MPNPMPPADRKHGTGDRNEAKIAHLDQQLHEERDADEAQDARQAQRDANRNAGFDHP